MKKDEYNFGGIVVNDARLRTENTGADRMQDYTEGPKDSSVAMPAIPTPPAPTMPPPVVVPTMPLSQGNNTNVARNIGNNNQSNTTYEYENPYNEDTSPGLAGGGYKKGGKVGVKKKK